MNAFVVTATINRETPVSVVRLAGTLDVTTAPEVRRAVMKCLAGAPDAVVIDISDMTVADDIALAVFPAMSRYAAGWPGASLVLAAPGDALSAALDRMAVCRYVPVYPTVEEALADPGLRGPAPHVREWLEPVPSSLATARAVVDKTCRSWGLAGLSEAAQLIVTELVSNVVRHAGTEMRVDLAMRRRFLRLAVYDRSSVLARLTGPFGEYAESGRGLILVEALAASWGCTPVAGGKAVWATLRLPSSAVR